MIVEAGAETAGVIVDGVEEVLTVEDEQIQDAPGADTTLIESIAKIGDRLVVLLKLSAIFAEPERRARRLSTPDSTQNANMSTTTPAAGRRR